MENTKTYTVTEDFFGRKVISYEVDGVYYGFTEDPANADYQEYLNSLENAPKS
jgi:hypothetical protein